MAADMVLVLCSNGLWCHVSEGINILDPLNYAYSHLSVSLTSSPSKFNVLLKWQPDDTRVQELLLCHMYATVKSILPSSPLSNSIPVTIISYLSSASSLGLFSD